MRTGATHTTTLLAKSYGSITAVRGCGQSDVADKGTGFLNLCAYLCVFWLRIVRIMRMGTDFPASLVLGLLDLFLFDDLTLFQFRFVLLVPFFAVISSHFLEIYGLVVEFSVIREQDKIGHVVGERNAGAFKVMRETGAAVEAPVVHDAAAQGSVQFFADAVFRYEQQFRLFFGRNEFVELQQGVVQVFGDVHAKEPVFFNPFLVLALIFLFVVRRAVLAENRQHHSEKKCQCHPKAVVLRIIHDFVQIVTLRIKLSIAEVFLLEFIGWFGLWLFNDYLATLLTLIIGAIVFAVLVIALISEAIERSKVPRRYFWVMAVSVLAPLLALGCYLLFFGGQFDFLKK